MNRTQHANGPVSLLVDSSIAGIRKHVNKHFLIWFAVAIAIFVFVLVLVKSDLFGGFVGLSLLVLLVIFGLGIYFLPTIKAYQEKRSIDKPF